MWIFGFNAAAGGAPDLSSLETISASLPELECTISAYVDHAADIDSDVAAVTSAIDAYAVETGTVGNVASDMAAISASVSVLKESSAAVAASCAAMSGTITATVASSAPIAQDSYYFEETTDVTNGNFTLSGLTVGSNSNRMLVAVVTMRNSVMAGDLTCTGVTWNGNSMTLRAEDDQIVNATRTEKMFWFDLYGTDVSTGNNDLVVSHTSSNNIDVICVYVLSYYNVAQQIGSAYEHTNSAGLGVATISDSITPASSGSLILVATMLADPTATIIQDAALTEISQDGAQDIQVSMGRVLPASSTLNYTQSYSGSNRRWSTMSAAYEKF